ncbi:MAG TPA: M20/M25/M40 family metallo-hydrolase [Anaeromyxobacter sp.]
MRAPAIAVALAALLVGGSRARAQELSPAERSVAGWVTDHLDDELAALEAVVNVDSATENLAGVREVGAWFRRRLEALGFTARWVELPEALHRAGHLVAERRGDAKGKRVLLLGHLDTVLQGPAHRFRRDGAAVRGAGAVDMKGGDVVILYALEALDATGLLGAGTVRVVLTGDEENPGLPIDVSRRDLVEVARQSDVALCFEADVGGKVTVARRGVTDWTLEVTGVQGHSAGVLQEEVGAGAAYEAARVVDGFRRAFQGQRSVTVNPALVLGGTEVTHDLAASAGTAAGKTNVVARSAVISGDLRFLTPAEEDRARARMAAIAARSLPRTFARLTFRALFPSMPPTRGNLAVLSVVDGVTRALGRGPTVALDPLERGAGDFSFIASEVSGVDGLGVAGEGSHGPDERMEVASLVPSTQRAAVAIARLLRAELGRGSGGRPRAAGAPAPMHRE